MYFRARRKARMTFVNEWGERGRESQMNLLERNFYFILNACVNSQFDNQSILRQGECCK